MAEKNKDHLADALAALSAGEHHEPDAQSHEEDTAPPPVAPVAPQRPATVRPTTSARPSAPAAPANSPAARPAMPAPIAKPLGKARPSAPAAPVPQGRPLTPGRPSAPAPPSPHAMPSPVKPRPTMPAAPTAPPARRAVPIAAAPPPPPVAPGFVAEEDFTQGPSEPAESNADDAWMGTAPVDDDNMMAPTPDLGAFGGATNTYKSTPTRTATKSDLKPTLIPILLTSGTLFIVFSVLKFFRGADSPYAALPGWVVGMVAGMGALLLGFAGFLMLQMKDQIARVAKK